MSRQANATLAYETYVRATPSQLWDALTDPAKTPAYVYGGAVRSDFEPDSSIAFVGPDGRASLEGTVLQAEPGARLVYTWRLLYSPEVAADRPSRVSWEITPLGEQVCKLTVVHDQLDGNTATFRDSAGGWPVILSGLKTLVETGEPLAVPTTG
jgi:uncharacterized protein YndB with AHSA1/START domain